MNRTMIWHNLDNAQHLASYFFYSAYNGPLSPKNVRMQEPPGPIVTI